MTANTPLVSICIPTYNGGEFLAAAIRSALAQTWPHIELVLSDDGSTDGSYENSERLLRSAAVPFRIVRHQSSTPAENWNHCARIASGRYIKYLFQDDLLEETCVARMMGLAADESRMGMVFCERHVLLEAASDERPALSTLADGIQDLHQPLQTLRPTQPGTELLRDPGLFERIPNNFGEPTAVLLDRQLLLDCGGFDGSYRQLLDVDCWLRLMARCHVGFVRQRLCTFRVHAQQLSLANMTSGSGGLEHARFFHQLMQSDLFQQLAPQAQERVYWHVRMSQIPRRRRTSRRYLGYAVRRLAQRLLKTIYVQRMNHATNRS